MRTILTILFFFNLSSVNNGNTQKAGMRQLWWNIMRIQVVIPPDPPPTSGPIGFGVNATGALPGDPTVTVTTTSGGTGVGSLYWALFTANGALGNPRSRKNIVFNIAGAGPHTINVDPNNRLEVSGSQSLSNVTIDGGSKVIQITSSSQNGLTFQGTGNHHVIIKNLYFVDCGSGDNNSEADGLNVGDGGHDFLITNCVAYGNTDGNIDFFGGAFNCTLMNTIIGNHISNQTDGAGGVLITTTDITVYHNLFNLKSADEGERGPFIHGNYDNAFGDVRNNIVYNFGRANATGSGFGSGLGYNQGTSDCGCFGRANFVNNYYYSPSVTPPDRADINGIDLSVDGKVGAGYSAGNVSGNGFNFNTGSYTNHAEWPVSSPYQLPVESACAAVHYVLTNVGPITKSTQAQTLINQITQLGTCYNEAPTLPFMDMYKQIQTSLHIYKWMQPSEDNREVANLICKSYNDQYFIREEEFKIKYI